MYIYSQVANVNFAFSKLANFYQHPMVLSNTVQPDTSARYVIWQVLGDINIQRQCHDNISVSKATRKQAKRASSITQLKTDCSVRDGIGQTPCYLNIILLYVLCGRRSLFRLTSITSSILCYVTASNPECWTVTKDIHGVGGVVHNFTSLEQCTEKCINDSSCVAIDWQPSFAGETCWILTYRFTREAIRRGVITHYAYKQSCRR